MMQRSFAGKIDEFMLRLLVYKDNFVYGEIDMAFEGLSEKLQKHSKSEAKAL